MKTLTLDDLKPFCGSERRGIALPWTCDGITYATNARLAVRVPFAVGGALSWNDTLRSLARQIEVWAKESQAKQTRATFLPVPANLPENEIRDCWHCEGTGKCKNTECCLDLCDECRDGKRVFGTLIEIKGVLFNSYYLRLVAALPNAEIAVRGEKDSSLIQFDGGIGWLMPVVRGPDYNAGKKVQVGTL